MLIRIIRVRDESFEFYRTHAENTPLTQYLTVFLSLSLSLSMSSVFRNIIFKKGRFLKTLSFHFSLPPTNRQKSKRERAAGSRAGHFRYFLIFSLIKNDFLHFLSS